MSPEGHGWPSESVCRCTGGFDPAVLDTGVCVCVFTAGTSMPMGTLCPYGDTLSLGDITRSTLKFVFFFTVICL